MKYRCRGHVVCKIVHCPHFNHHTEEECNTSSLGCKFFRGDSKERSFYDVCRSEEVELEEQIESKSW